jgi:hypothetical protein
MPFQDSNLTPLVRAPPLHQRDRCHEYAEQWTLHYNYCHTRPQPPRVRDTSFPGPMKPFQGTCLQIREGDVLLPFGNQKRTLQF